MNEREGMRWRELGKNERENVRKRMDEIEGMIE